MYAVSYNSLESEQKLFASQAYAFTIDIKGKKITQSMTRSCMCVHAAVSEWYYSS